MGGGATNSRGRGVRKGRTRESTRKGGKLEIERKDRQRYLRPSQMLHFKSHSCLFTTSMRMPSNWLEGDYGKALAYNPSQTAHILARLVSLILYSYNLRMYIVRLHNSDALNFLELLIRLSAAYPFFINTAYLPNYGTISDNFAVYNGVLSLTNIADPLGFKEILEKFGGFYGSSNALDLPGFNTYFLQEDKNHRGMYFLYDSKTSAPIPVGPCGLKEIVLKWFNTANEFDTLLFPGSDLEILVKRVMPADMQIGLYEKKPHGSGSCTVYEDLCKFDQELGTDVGVMNAIKNTYSLAMTPSLNMGLSDTTYQTFKDSTKETCSAFWGSGRDLMAKYVLEYYTAVQLGSNTFEEFQVKEAFMEAFPGGGTGEPTGEPMVETEQDQEPQDAQPSEYTDMYAILQNVTNTTIPGEQHVGEQCNFSMLPTMQEPEDQENLLLDEIFAP